MKLSFISRTKTDVTERISQYKEGSWHCLCGNDAMSDGFYPCNEAGREVEPTAEEWQTNAYVCAMILLWNNHVDEAIIRSKEFIEDRDMISNFSMGIQPYLMLLIAKKQYQYTFELFERNEHNIKDKYKPIYYSLMYFMQSSHPDEFKRMGNELSQTVEEIIDQINQMRKDYV